MAQITVRDLDDNVLARITSGKAQRAISGGGSACYFERGRRDEEEAGGAQVSYVIHWRSNK